LRQRVTGTEQAGQKQRRRAAPEANIQPHGRSTVVMAGL
jgi:hypothetical protein